MLSSNKGIHGIVGLQSDSFENAVPSQSEADAGSSC